MEYKTAANDMFVRHSAEALRCGESGIDIPKGHVGPVLMSDTGRTVWWTGRVAIGLRYQPPQHSEFCGQSALWVQDMLLRRAGELRHAVDAAAPHRAHDRGAFTRRPAASAMLAAAAR